MDAIAVARAGISQVIASCGTSLTEMQVKLLSRFTRRVIVNYDPDTAGQAATERSLSILLEQNCDARVLALPGGKDPDSFIRSAGRGGLRQTAGGRAAVSGLPDRPGAAAGHRHGGRKAARGEFPAAVRAAHSQRAVALGVGLAHLAAIARGPAGAAGGTAPRRHRAAQPGEDPRGAGRAARPAGRAAPGETVDGSRTICARAWWRKSGRRNCIAAWRPRRSSPRCWKPAPKANRPTWPRWRKGWRIGIAGCCWKSPSRARRGTRLGRSRELSRGTASAPGGGGAGGGAAPDRGAAGVSRWPGRGYAAVTGAQAGAAPAAGLSAAEPAAAVTVQAGLPPAAACDLLSQAAE